MGLDANRVRETSLWHFYYQVEGWNDAHAQPGERGRPDLPDDDDIDAEIAQLYRAGVIKH